MTGNFRDVVRGFSRLGFEVGVTAHAGFEGVHDFAAFAGGDAVAVDGAFGELTEAAEHVFGLVFAVGEDFGDGVAFDFLGVFEFAVLDADGDDVGVAEEVVEVTEGFLIGADEEDADDVVFAGVFEVDVVEGEAVVEFAGVGEFVDFAIGVASDVGEDSVAGGFVFEMMDGHDREDLVDGPEVGEALEDAEVAVIVVGHDRPDAFHLGAVDAHGFLAFGDPGEEFPVEFLALGALAEGDFAVAELAAEFVSVVAGVVVDFLEAIHVGGGFEAFAVAGVFLEFVEVADEGRGVFGDADLAMGFEAVDVEDVDEEDGVVGDDGAAGLGDDVGMGDSSFTGDFGDGFDDVGAVFLGTVVAAGLGGAFEAVVADGETAAEVEDAHAGAFLDEADVDAGGFGDGLADGADVGDLGALVVVEHAEAVEHAFFTKVVDDVHELGDVQAEDGGVTAGASPVAGAFGGEAEADAEGGADAHFFAALEDEFELAGHFQDHDDLEAHFLGVEGEVDELFVFVTVADDVGLRVVHVGEGGDEFGFAAGFEAVVVFAAVAGDFLDDFLLLIDLDGVNAPIDALVFGFFDGGVEAFVEFINAPAEEVAEAEEDGELGAAFAEAAGDLDEADGFGGVAVFEVHDDLAFSVDVEVAMAPLAHAIHLGAFFDAPRRGGGF